MHSVSGGGSVRYVGYGYASRFMSDLHASLTSAANSFNGCAMP
jgi:hypothetical protein